MQEIEIVLLSIAQMSPFLCFISHLWLYIQFSTKTYAVGTQKNPKHMLKVMKKILTILC